MPEHIKSAEERARQMADWAGLLPYSPGWHAFVGGATRSLMQYASDQRRLCTEAIPHESAAPHVAPNPLKAHADALDAAGVAVLKTPAPGEHNV